MPALTPVNRLTATPKHTLSQLLPQGNPSRALLQPFQWPGTLNDDHFQAQPTGESATELPADRSRIIKEAMAADWSHIVVNAVTIVHHPKDTDHQAVRPFLRPSEQVLLNGLAQKNGYLNAQEMWQSYYTQIHQQRRLAENLLGLREKLSRSAEKAFTDDLAKRVKSPINQMPLTVSDCPDGLTLQETIRLTAALLPSMGYEATRVTNDTPNHGVIMAYRPIPVTQRALFDTLQEVDHQVLFPQVASTSAGSIDFMQGSVGTCWVLSPLYALLNHPVTQKAVLDRITPPSSPHEPFQTTWYQRGRNNAITLTPLVISTAPEHLVQTYRTPTDWLNSGENTWRRSRVVGPLGVRLLETAFDLYQSRMSQPEPKATRKAHDKAQAPPSLWDRLDQQYRDRQPFTAVYGGESLQAMKELAHGFTVFSLDDMPWKFPGFFTPPADKTQIPLWRRITPKSRDRGALVDDPEVQASSHLWALHKLFSDIPSAHRYVGVASTRNTERPAYKHLSSDYQRVGLTSNHSYAVGSVDPVRQEIAWVNPHNTTKKPVVLSFRDSVTLLSDMVIVDTASS